MRRRGDPPDEVDDRNQRKRRTCLQEASKRCVGGQLRQSDGDPLVITAPDPDRAGCG